MQYQTILIQDESGDTSKDEITWENKECALTDTEPREDPLNQVTTAVITVVRHMYKYETGI